MFEKEGNREIVSTRKRERERENARGKSIADALEKSLPFLGE